MSVFKSSRGQLWVFGIALVWLLTVTPLLQLACGNMNKHLDAIRSDRVKAEHALRQAQENTSAAQKLGTNGAERLLTPVDRLHIASLLEQQARAARLNHFTYTISPEQKISVQATDALKQELAQSTVTLAGEAAQDVDVYNFIDQLQQLLPGQARLRELSIERIGDTLQAYNLRMSATFDWLSNNTSQNIAGTP